MTTGPILLKLGGALITDKQGHEAPRPDVIDRLAGEIAGWLAVGGPLILSHGSGSFAHRAARATGLLAQPGDRLALAKVSASARRLNALVIEALIEHGVPAVGLPGAAVGYLEDGQPNLRSEAVLALLDGGVLPVVYGDAVVDTVRGGGIMNTETLLVELARAVGSHRLVLATDVPGVLDRTVTPAVTLPRITPESLDDVLPGVGGADARTGDVTGGMAAKVTSMVGLVRSMPGVEVLIVSGAMPGAVPRALNGDTEGIGTRIVSDSAGEGT